MQKFSSCEPVSRFAQKRFGAYALIGISVIAEWLMGGFRRSDGWGFIDLIPAVRRTKSEIADMLGVSRQHLHNILEEKKPISPEMAVKIGKLFGSGAASWIRMQAAQAAYDTWHAEQTVDVSKIKRLEVA